MSFIYWKAEVDAIDRNGSAVKFANDLNPTLYIFGADRISNDVVRIVAHPLDALRYFEGGEGSAGGFLTDTFSANQMKYLLLFLDDTSNFACRSYQWQWNQAYWTN